jgi:single-strand DNA-binding protein
MSQGAFVTLVGYVAQEPNIRTTKTGKTVTDLRVGITPRYKDQATGEWRDGQSSYFTVSCWDRLANHVRASMHKGEPVLVRGKFKTSTFEDRDGRPRTETRITADTVGHDLSRGVANYIRHRPGQAAANAGAPGDQGPGSQDQREGQNPDEGQNLGQGQDDMIDEDAIERFGRDLDDADLAARGRAEDEDEDDDDGEDEDAAIAASTGASATPY